MKFRTRLLARFGFAVAAVYLVITATFLVVVFTPDTNLQGMLGTAFSAWIVVALVVGIGLVVFSGGLALSLIGIVLIVLGLIGIMPALRFTIFKDPHR